MSSDTLYIVGIISIIFLIFVCLILYCFRKEERHELTKFIGGFAVILVSLYAQNGLVYSLAIFITGLIIASERFMSMLVAFFKADKSFLQSENFLKFIDKMSGEEIKKKQKEDLDEIKLLSGSEKEIISKKDAEQNRERNYSKTEKQPQLPITLLPEIEKKALIKYEKHIHFAINKDVKISNIMFDGVGVNPRNRAIYLFEVKVFPNINDNWSTSKITNYVSGALNLVVPKKLYQISSLLEEKIFPFGSQIYLTFIVVVNTSQNLDDLKEEHKKLKSQFNKANSRIITKYIVYNLPKLDS